MTPSRRPSLTHGPTAEDAAAVGQTVDAVAAMLATVAGGDADGASSEAVGEVRIQSARKLTICNRLDAHSFALLCTVYGVQCVQEKAIEATEGGDDAAPPAAPAPPPVPPPEQRIVEPQFQVPPYATAEVHVPPMRHMCCQC